MANSISVTLNNTALKISIWTFASPSPTLLTHVLLVTKQLTRAT